MVVVVAVVALTMVAMKVAADLRRIQSRRYVCHGVVHVSYDNTFCDLGCLPSCHLVGWLVRREFLHGVVCLSHDNTPWVCDSAIWKMVKREKEENK